jgi:hypothetical protein
MSTLVYEIPTDRVFAVDVASPDWLVDVEEAVAAPISGRARLYSQGRKEIDLHAVRQRGHRLWPTERHRFPQDEDVLTVVAP